MSAAGAGRPAKRARLEADKRRDALAEVEDKYADIDFTRFQKVVDIDTDADGEATPLRFVLVRPVETALVKDWRQWSSYEPDEAGETLSGGGLAHLCTTRRQRRHYTGPLPRWCWALRNCTAPQQLGRGRSIGKPAWTPHRRPGTTTRGFVAAMMHWGTPHAG